MENMRILFVRFRVSVEYKAVVSFIEPYLFITVHGIENKNTKERKSHEVVVGSFGFKIFFPKLFPFDILTT